MSDQRLLTAPLLYREERYMFLGNKGVYFVQASAIVFFVIDSLIFPAQAASIKDIQTQCFTSLRGLVDNNRVSELCRRATPYTSRCFAEMRTLISNDQAANLCQGATPYTNVCFIETRSLGSNSTAVELCQYASDTTVECFKGMQTTVGTTEALKRCIPAPENKLDACSQAILFDPQGLRNQISEPAAQRYCRFIVK